jgi:Sulfate permease family
MTPTPRAQPLEPRGLQRYLPILHWLPKYDRSRLSADLLAGVTVWALLVPQRLAYASLAGASPRSTGCTPPSRRWWSMPCSARRGR